MAVAFVQSQSGQAAASASPQSAMFGSNVTVRNLIVVAVTGVGSSNTPSFAISDNLGNTYVSAIRKTGLTRQAVEIFYAKNITAGSCTVTVTPSGSITTALSWCQIEYSGADLTTPLDGVNSGNGTSNTPSSGSVTVSGSGEFITGITTVTPAIGITFTAGLANDRDNFVGTMVLTPLDVADQSVSANTTATWTLDSSRAWLAAAATFQPPLGLTAAGMSGLWQMSEPPPRPRLNVVSY